MKLPEGCKVRALCRRSYNKTERHKLHVEFKDNDIHTWTCSCAVGKGLCHHVLALLYQISCWKTRGKSCVPPVVSQISRPQTWHIPPPSSTKPRPVSSMIVQQPIRTRDAVNDGKDRRDGTRSRLYNPIVQPLANIATQIPHLRDKLSSLPSPTQCHTLWPLEPTGVHMVQSRFGSVPRGSPLSYQCPPPRPGTADIINIPAPSPPPFDQPNISRTSTALPLNQDLAYTSLLVTPEECKDYEQCTKKQSLTPKWHALRRGRLTASNFHRICRRQRNHEKLASELLTKKSIQTAAMKYGLDHEGEAAEDYATNNNFNVYEVGLIINPSVRHLGASPDRRVYDPSEISPWGLLEVKHQMKSSYALSNHLQKKDDGTYTLKKGEHLYQVMGQLGISGALWCDYLLVCEDDFFLERIRFSQAMFEEMVAALDDFYFAFFLPQYVTKKLC